MSSTPYYGQQRTMDDKSDHNATDFHIRQVMGRVRTGIPVKVIAVSGGGVGSPPTVDVTPLVNQFDSQGNKTAHGDIYGIPVLRVQGGSWAIIADPVVGDIGYMLCADRDISAVKANKGVSNPGSYRRHNLSDGVYIAAMLAPTPTQYVEFTSTGITIKDKNNNTIVMGPSGINLNGLIIDSSGNVTTPGGVQSGTGGGDSVTLQHHTHGGGPAPTPGT